MRNPDPAQGGLKCGLAKHVPPSQVLVNVNDINDNVPTFPRDYEGPFDVTEGQPGPRVWTFRAHDRDSGPNGQVEYSIVDGDPLGEWGLTGRWGQHNLRA